VFLGLRGMPHFIVAVRRSHEGESWILRATVNFMAFNSLVENLRIGKTGTAFILNKAGKLQTGLNSREIPLQGPCMDFLKGPRQTGNEVHIVEKCVDSGQKNIYVASFLKDGDWVMIYKQDREDAFSDLRRSQMTAIMIFVIGGLGIVVMALLLSKRMVNRIEKADQEKEMMNQQVIETGKLASIGQLAAGIAHEINNPVAIMVEEAGWMQDLLEEDDLRQSKNLEEFERALEQIKTQGKRCKEITHKLLSFARKTDSQIHNVQINELIEELVAISFQSARYSKVIINTDFGNIPSVRMSQSEMQQVLLNLINNALYAMDKQGGNLDIHTRVENENLVIKVADDGPGIPKANLNRIFDPFFTTKPVGKGTGLGLSICYGIIRKMGGQIDVQSMVDVGTTFYIRVPLRELEA